MKMAVNLLDSVKWRADVKMAVNLQVPHKAKARNLLSV